MLAITTTTYVYWVAIYSAEGAFWEVDSYLCCREYPSESLLYPGWYEDEPLEGQWTWICGPVVRPAGMLDSDFDVLTQPCKDATPDYPPGYAPSSAEPSSSDFEDELSSSESSGYDDD